MELKDINKSWFFFSTCSTHLKRQLPPHQELHLFICSVILMFKTAFELLNIDLCVAHREALYWAKYDLMSLC